MGLLDRALDAFSGAPPALLNPNTRLLQATLALVSEHGQNGGIQDLILRFQEAGLGNVIASWIGSGPNLPVGAAQIRQVLGLGQLGQIAEEAALTQDETAERLAETLPGLVDKLTPEGRLPSGGLGDVASLLGRVLGS